MDALIQGNSFAMPTGITFDCQGDQWPQDQQGQQKPEP